MKTEISNQQINATKETRPVEAGSEIKQTPVFERVTTMIQTELITRESLEARKAELEAELASINQALKEIESINPEA